VAGELGGDHLPGIDPAAVGALQGADLGRFDAADIAVDLWDGRFSFAGQLRIGGE
jgi:hypothetical protein